jgi:hypothetical protein
MSNEYSATEQPDPIQNSKPACWDLVIERMRQRDALGRKKYGTPLQPHNGRNALQDFSEELLDAIVYSEQLQTELKWLGRDLQTLLVKLVALRYQGMEDLAESVSLLELILVQNPVLNAG